MIFGDLGGLKLPDICLTGEEKPRKNLTQESCPDRGSNPGPLRDRRACYRLLHSGGQLDLFKIMNCKNCINLLVTVFPGNFDYVLRCFKKVPLLFYLTCCRLMFVGEK